MAPATREGPVHPLEREAPLLPSLDVLRIGITGHVHLSATTKRLVAVELESVLSAYADGVIVGVSCLAPGTDTIFAEVALMMGAQLEVIVPARDYPATQLTSAQAARFNDLCGAADLVIRLPIDRSGPVAYAAANDELLSRIDRLIAVWDGVADLTTGGTGSVVNAASCPVDVIWPDGAERNSHS